MKNQSGGMLTELLLTMAIAAIVLPFIARFNMARVQRAENIQVVREMQGVQSALERYMDANKENLLRPTGRAITRVNLADLANFGVTENMILKYGDDFQMRILKSADAAGHATLQGAVVLENDDISPLRTREIMNLGDGKIGFAERGQAFGAFGTWKTSGTDLGLADVNGIVGLTDIRMDQDRYLWRVPSEKSDDATMLADLGMGEHNIIGANLVAAHGGEFAEIMSAKTIAANQIIFQTKPEFSSNTFLVNGINESK